MAVVAQAVLCLSGPLCAQTSQKIESVLIETSKPYTKVVSDIQALGGRVKQQYQYVDAVAAEVPSNAMGTLRALTGPGKVVKDLSIPAPAANVFKHGKSGLPTASTRSASLITNFSTVPEAAYRLNNLGLNVRDLHTQGLTGSGVIVAVVDTGVQPRFPLLDKDNAVVGGVDLVGDGMGFSNPNNEPHGTFVAGLITGNILFGLGANSNLASSLNEHFPGALVGNDLPLVGTAPSSSIYAVRVFGVNASAGAPESRIIAAIDHLIDIRKKFDRHEKGGVNIQVCNLSLGNTTLNAGRDLFDRSVDALLKNGIVPVVSAGDAGPSGLTVSSPATSQSAIAVGAVSAAANERVEQDVANVLGFGKLYRPSDATQVAFFSARGPNADGRVSPSVVAVGLGNFGQGYDSTSDINMSDGTSFSAPLVAGIAAVLRQAFPRADATEIRNAIVQSGDPSGLTSRFSSLDYGEGFPDAKKAKALLAAGRVSDSLPSFPKPGKSVAENLEEGTNLHISDESIVRSTGNLSPGERAEILYEIPEDTTQVVINVTNFNATFNQMPNPNAFPEQIYLQVHSAKTSQIGALGDYYNLGDPYITGGTFTIPNPEPGIMRITFSGSYTNAGKVSAKVTVSSETERLRGVTTRGTIQHHQQIMFPLTVPPGVRRADFRLSFGDNWGHYPTSDMDMILVDPNLNQNDDGARLNSPEAATVVNPTPGTWQVIIDGFDIPAGSDTFALRVTLDGKLVK